jgi:hypothetical protein
MFFDRFSAMVAAPAAPEGAAPAAAPAFTPPAISVWSMLPKELFGVPVGILIGLGLWGLIFILIFKGYVLG